MSIDRGAGRAVWRLRWVVGVLTVATAYLAWPLWPALVLAAWTAELARPLLGVLERVLRGRRRAATLISLLLVVVIALPFVLIGLVVVVGVNDLRAAFLHSASARGALEALAAGTNGSALHWPSNASDLVELLQRFGAAGLGLLTKLAGAATLSLVMLLFYFGGAFVFLFEGPLVTRWLKQNWPLGERALARATAAFYETGHGLLVGVGLTVAAQAVVATALYFALGVPRAWALGPITGLASMIPIVGTALVWGPVAAGLFLSGHVVKGTILAVLGFGLIGTIDNVVRPIFSRLGSLQLPTFLLYISIFGGIVTVGPWGAILGPLIARMWMEAAALLAEEAA